MRHLYIPVALLRIRTGSARHSHSYRYVPDGSCFFLDPMCASMRDKGSSYMAPLYRRVRPIVKQVSFPPLSH